MTIMNMLNALPVVQKMAEMKLPIKSAYKVYSLAKVINEQREFFINEERKLINNFSAEILDDGSIKFSSAEDQAKFLQEHSEMSNLQIEGVEPIELKFEELGDAEFSPLEIGLLEGVINFI